jgi:hypothetical protein
MLAHPRHDPYIGFGRLTRPKGRNQGEERPAFSELGQGWVGGSDAASAEASSLRPASLMSGCARPLRRAGTRQPFAS